LFLVLQAALADCLLFDPLPFSQDGFIPEGFSMRAAA
jgi:hypothetical protein